MRISVTRGGQIYDVLSRVFFLASLLSSSSRHADGDGCRCASIRNRGERSRGRIRRTLRREGIKSEIWGRKASMNTDPRESLASTSRSFAAEEEEEEDLTP